MGTGIHWLTYGWPGDYPHPVYGEPAHAQAEPALVEAEAVLRVTTGAEQPVSLSGVRGGVTVGDQCGAGAGEIILGCQLKFFKKDK